MSAKGLAGWLLFCGLLSPLAGQHQQGDDKRKRNPAVGNPAAIAAGAKAFNETCAVCHGKGGQGGRGPNLAQGRVAWHSLSDDSTFQTIRDGIPSGGMPPTPGSDDKIWQLTAYVRALRAPAIETPLSGDAKIGESVFWGKGGCNECHSIRGRGGKLGPDLTNVGGTRSVELIRESILDPTADGAWNYRKAIVTLQDGRKIEGVVRNHTNYSLQMIDARGEVHLLSRAEVRTLEIGRKSPMPADYGKRLSREEIDGLIAYLGRQSVRPAEIALN